MTTFDRLERFHKNQVWESPNGTLYKVICVVTNGKAILRLGDDGEGKKIERDWDAVIGWVLYKDAPEPVLSVAAEHLEDIDAELLTFTNLASGEVDGFMTLSYKDRLMCMGHGNPRYASATFRPPHKAYKGRNWQAKMRKDALAFYARNFDLDPDSVVFGA